MCRSLKTLIIIHVVKQCIFVCNAQKYILLCYNSLFSWCSPQGMQLTSSSAALFSKGEQKSKMTPKSPGACWPSRGSRENWCSRSNEKWKRWLKICILGTATTWVDPRPNRAKKQESSSLESWLRSYVCLYVFKHLVMFCCYLFTVLSAFKSSVFNYTTEIFPSLSDTRFDQVKRPCLFCPCGTWEQCHCVFCHIAVSLCACGSANRWQHFILLTLICDEIRDMFCSTSTGPLIDTQPEVIRWRSLWIKPVCVFPGDDAGVSLEHPC